MKTKEGFARDGASVRFNGTPEQLMNALRELERRGGATGAICSAAANEIERLRAALEPFAAEPLSTEPEHNRTMLFSFADQDDKIRRAREALSN